MMASPRWRLAALIFAMLFVESSAAQDGHHLKPFVPATDEVVEVTGAPIPFVNGKYYVQKGGVPVFECIVCIKMYVGKFGNCPQCSNTLLPVSSSAEKKWATTDVNLVCEDCGTTVKKDTPCDNCNCDRNRLERCSIVLKRDRSIVLECPQCHSDDKEGRLEKGCLKRLKMNCPNAWHYCTQKKCQVGNRCKKPGQVPAANTPADTFKLRGRRIKSSGRGGGIEYVCHRCRNPWKLPEAAEYRDLWHINNARGNSLYWNETVNGQLPMNSYGWKYLPMTSGGHKLMDPNKMYKWWEGGVLMGDSKARCPKLCPVVSSLGPWVKANDAGWCETCEGTGYYNNSDKIVLKKYGRRRLQELTGYRTINRLLREEKRSRRTSNLPDRV